MLNKNKDFKQDLELFNEKLKSMENFAFVRFSDGEADILKNIKLEIRSDYVIEGDVLHNFGYSEEDHKSFDPDKHGFVREKLYKSYRFDKKNYFTGIGCPCCIGGINIHTAMKRGINRPSSTLTWANLFVNGNYKNFIEKTIPILSDRKIVFVCSENANIENAAEELNFNVVKDFRVGKNCIVNDHHLADEIKDWIENNKIENHVFLFSASSLSEILIHELYDAFDNNTYLDIGTTMHPYFDLGYERDYLKGYWKNEPLPDSTKVCKWVPDIRLVYNNPKYWEDIRNLRNNPNVKKGFINQKHISKEEHTAFMLKHGDDFFVSLWDNSFVGYVGIIDNDIRIATIPEAQGHGIAAFMLKNVHQRYPESIAKVKLDNEASIKLFEKCGFRKKYYILEKESE